MSGKEGTVLESEQRLGVRVEIATNSAGHVWMYLFDQDGATKVFTL